MSQLFDISHKTILVTGGANGLGRMIAEGLVKAGADVIITTRKSDTAESAIQELRKHGRCEAIVCDISTSEAIGQLVRDITSTRDAVHVVINNAGRTWGAPLAKFPDSAWDPVMSVNVQAPFTLVRDLLPLLRNASTEDDPARVLNIGSMAGIAVEKISAYSYAASKAAIHHLSKVMAADLADDGIAVNVIAPGYFPTKMMAHIENDKDELSKLTSRVPMGRVGRPDDIAGLCVFMCSKGSAYITGTLIPVDGGLSGCR